MANVRSPEHSFFFFFLAFMLAVVVQTSAQVVGYQHKVGDLDAWGIPTSANPLVYAKWSKYHTFRIGDSLLFLYPPSQDSVIQVTQQSYNSCNITDPILYMNNGNSLFNITAFGDLFFTSGEPGHCGKKQKLHISVLSGNASAANSPSYGPSALPEISPSYPTVFGTIPAPPSSSSPSPNFPVLMASAFGFVVCALLGGIM